MRAGTWNLIFGLATVAAGVSGKFRLIGTNSSMWLIVAGGAMAAFGLVQLLRSERR